jgi:hypothetical protein
VERPPWMEALIAQLATFALKLLGAEHLVLVRSGT